MRFPSVGPAYAVVTGYGFEVADPVTVPAAVAKIEQALTPATAEQCEGWLVMLQAACAHRSDSEITSAVAYTVYAAELRRWPADVAKSACERLARGKIGHTGPNWFPTLAELYAECERLAAPRKALLASLQRWVPTPQRIESARGREEPTEAQKAAVKRMADDALAQLKASSDAKRAKAADLPSIAGKTDERGVTPEMRALMARRQGQ